jgi:hypothetical protein
MNHLYPGRKKHSQKVLPLLIQNAEENCCLPLKEQLMLLEAANGLFQFRKVSSRWKVN